MRIRALLVLLVLLLALASQGARFLVVDAPQHSDAIIVLAGETYNRPAHAVELLRQGMASRIFIDVEGTELIYDQPRTDIAQRYINSLPEKDRVAVCPITGLSTYGETDELGFNSVSDRVHVHDLHATILHLLGLDHKKLTFRFQGRDFRLTDVHGELVTKLLA